VAAHSFLDEVMESVDETRPDPAVEYLGGKDLEGIVEAIQQCDVGVIPNHRNLFTELNTPTRIFECLALGKPSSHLAREAFRTTLQKRT
jgi:hypothetical protein